MTKTMSESVHLPEAQKTLSDASEMASTRIRTALTFLVDCVHTSAGIKNGELRPNAGKLRLTSHADASEMQRRRAKLGLQAFASNLPRAAQAIAISAAHNALAETFGTLPDPNQPTLSELDTLRWFVYLVECCYAHDPLRPTWKIDAPNLSRRFQFPALGIEIDTSKLDGQRFDPLIVGGTGGFMRLVDHCRKVIEADAPTGDASEAV